MTLPFSPSADRNKEAIGDALEKWLLEATSVFEFGSGTGQHAVYLCQQYPALHWQPSELEQNLPALTQLLQQANANNIRPPIACDVLAWPQSAHTATGAMTESSYGFTYSANTAHIMSMEAVTNMISLAASLLQPDGYFALYGPFRYGTEHTGVGNIRFDAMLRESDASMGVRDKFALDELAQRSGMACIEDIAMPSDNRILIWQKSV